MASSLTSFSHTLSIWPSPSCSLSFPDLTSKPSLSSNTLVLKPYSTPALKPTLTLKPSMNSTKLPSTSVHCSSSSSFSLHPTSSAHPETPTSPPPTSTPPSTSANDDFVSQNPKPWNTVLGVLGGGQLARMLCQAASPLALKLAVLDPMHDAPAGPIAHRHVIGSFQDEESVRRFAEGCDILTVEIEHVDVETLEKLSQAGVDVEPKPWTIAIIQDKYAQKVYFRERGIPLPDFVVLDSVESAVEAGRKFGYPLMLKSRRLAYDGRGNAVAKSEEQLGEAISALGGIDRGLYAEKWAPFVKELAIMVARGRDGDIRSYPVVETTHKDNICHTVIAPAPVSEEIKARALKVAEKAIGSLKGAGVFGVELFLLASGEVLLNEVAPRPHNSGHYSIEACRTSQYEQHLRAVLDVPLGDPSMRVPAAAMINILGEKEGEEGFRIAFDLMKTALGVPGVSVHWYDKREIRPQRKMGHLTIVGPSMEIVQERLQILRGKSNQTDTTISVDVSEGGGEAGKVARVGVIMGSDSDLPIMKSASEILELFGVEHEVTIVSAHRTPERLLEYSQNAHKRGVKVIIGGAGGAAHLPGMVAALTPLPVIGVPVRTSLDGLDSLLSIVQMPRGVPVATVAINNSTNAALLAVRMLGASDPSLLEKMLKYQEEMKSTVLDKAEKLERIGWKEYLKSDS